MATSHPRERVLYCVRWVKPSGRIGRRLFLRPNYAERFADRQQKDYATAPVQIWQASIGDDWEAVR